MPTVHRTALGCALALALALHAPAGAAPPEDKPSTSLARQTLGDALRELARRADLQILFDPQLVAGTLVTPPAVELAPRQALSRLLQGTGLEAHESSAGVLVIRRAAAVQAHPLATAAVKAPAQEQGVALGEIIVTSQRRAERLQEVPVSIQAYDRAAMEIRGVHEVDEIARLTPGISFNRGRNYNSESSEIAIRGIGSTAGAATTGVYIDDTPIQTRHLSFGTFNAYPALFDLERVEVLRGPQGTLFGAGSEGGTVRFITPEPSLIEDLRYARAEWFTTEHGASGFEAGAAAGGPVVEQRLGARISGSYRREGGYVDRIDWHRGFTADADANTAVTSTVRLALKWAAGDSLTVNPSLYYQRRHVADTSAYWARVPGSADPSGGQFDEPLRNGNNIANPSTDVFHLWALRLNWDLAGVSLISNSSYFDRRQAAVTDYSTYNRAVLLGDPYPPADVRAPTQWVDEQQNWTQELRLESSDPSARLTWTAGAFAQRARENTVENVFDPALVAQLQLPVFRGGYIYFQQPFRSTDTQVALFGQADWRLSDVLKLTLGLRFTHARFDGEAFFAGPVVGEPVSSRGRFSENPVTPKIGISYRLNGEDLLYATIAKGYRIGGANAAVGQMCYGGPDSALGSIGLSQVPPEYGADSVWSYEVGAKSAFAGRRITLDASAYWIQWKNIQQTVPLTACGFQFVANLGRAQSRGLDVQAHVQVSHSLQLGFSLGVTDAFYSKTVRLAPAALSLVQDGDHLAASPWTLAAFAQGHRALANWDAYARADFQYGARQRATVPNSNALNGGNPEWFAGVPAQSSTSLRLGARRAGWDVSLFVQNLFDTRPRLTVNQDVGLGPAGTPLLYVISWRPRTAGVTAAYRY